MKIIVALILLAMPGLAAAQSVTVDASVVSDCLTYTDIGETNPSCLGTASNACQQASPDGSTTPGIVDCIQSETGIWDRFLNEEYQELRGAMQVADAGDSGGISRVDALRDAQRAWIAFRDAECSWAYAQWQGGTMRSIVGANCKMVMTAQRTLALRDMRQNGN